VEIKERKQIELWLRDSEERFRLSSKTSKTTPSSCSIRRAWWSVGTKGPEVSMAISEEILGRHVLSFISGGARQGTPDQLLKPSDPGRTGRGRGASPAQGGSTYWADTVVTALFDKQKQLRGFARSPGTSLSAIRRKKKFQLYRDICQQYAARGRLFSDWKIQRTKNVTIDCGITPAPVRWPVWNAGSMVGKNHLGRIPRSLQNHPCRTSSPR